MVDVLVRKKILKIQDRLGMRIGISYGIKANPSVKTTAQAIEALKELYKIGLKAFVLPKTLFSDISTTSDLYKTKYGNLLKIREEAKRYNIELSLRHTELSEQPDETLRIFCTIAGIMDCRNFIITPNFYSRIMPKDQALRLSVYKINEIITSLGTRVKLGIETTGKTADVGSLEDVVDIVKRTHSTEPVLNFGNIHARDGGFLRTRRDFGFVLGKVREAIGLGYLQSAYFIFSGVSYGSAGLTGYIPILKSDINLEYLIRESMAAGAKGTFIFDDTDKEQFVLKMMDKLADMVR